MTRAMTNETRRWNDDERWRAVARRDRRADDRFVYAVKTTGVYCRPSCAARLAKRENVEFFDRPADAERAGYRACKRCRPNETADDPQRRAVAAACERIAASDTTPSLSALADAAGFSPSHFHRVFKSLVGVSPKAYAAERRSRKVRDELAGGAAVSKAMHAAGFNSNGRFYANAAKTLGMNPSTYRAGGDGRTIRFAVGECSLGSILVAASDLGVCAIELGDDPDALARSLQARFSNAKIVAGDRDFERLVATVVGFVERPSIGLDLPLDVRGTAFQQRVWSKLREIPCGQIRTYAQLAADLGRPSATRAVASACAANALAVAIPCHRVVRTDGGLSGYRWGVERKARLLAAERAAAKSTR